jgi:DNA modification methylase
LQEDGWWVRMDNVWAKPNPMPESITDRPTKSHEYVFLLTKAERYYYDAEAIKEEGAGRLDAGRGSEGRIGTQGWKGKPRPSGVQHKQAELGQQLGGHLGSNDPFANRNKRSVWTIATSPFPEAHFATFPPELPEICILAGTSQKGCCAKCGAPWGRETESRSIVDPRPMTTGAAKKAALGGLARTSPQGRTCGSAEVTTLGWSPSCSCNADVKPCTVLDPFSGAGTTALVADRLQRNAIGIELNPTYAAMSEKRINGDRGALLDLMEAAQ